MTWSIQNYTEKQRYVDFDVNSDNKKKNTGSPAKGGWGSSSRCPPYI